MTIFGLFITIILFISSCQPNLNEVIISKWIIETLNVSNLDEAHTKFENAYHVGFSGQKFEETLLKEFEGVYFEFDQNHKVKIGKGENMIQGEWSIADHKIIMQSSEVYSILTEKVSENKIEGEFQYKVRGIRIKSQIVIKKEK